MNFLQVCQEVDRTLGSQGTVSSVSGASGYTRLLVDYVANAWIDIQARRKNWDFLRRSVNISLVQGQTQYTIFQTHTVTEDPVGTWIVDTFRNTDDYSILRYIDPFEWDERDQTAQRKPSAFTVRENATLGYLEFDNPDGIYNINAYYYAKPQELTDNTDELVAPVEFHSILVHHAAANIAAYLGNLEAHDLHSNLAESMMGSLLRAQNPGLKATGPTFV